MKLSMYSAVQNKKDNFNVINTYIETKLPECKLRVAMLSQLYYID